MIIRRSMLALTAAALVLTGCASTGAGTDADPAETEAAAEQDDASSDEVEEPTAAQPDADDEHDDTMTDDADDANDADDDAMTDDEHDDAMTDDESAAGQDVDRVVEVDMDDMSFSVQELEFAAGERVRFDFENVGAAPHEALIGDLHVQEEHEQQMADSGGHDDEGHHGDLSMISLEPGESGSLVHEFTEPGELWMGCHVPGHWGAGMRTRVTVTG